MSTTTPTPDHADIPTTDAISVRIYANDKGIPVGKLADAEMHFTAGPLAGLKLLGFAIWERRNGGGRNVTFPSRQYSVNREHRSFALLRPIAEIKAQDNVRDLVLSAYARFEAGQYATPAPHDARTIF
jgi:hypothetical protein